MKVASDVGPDNGIVPGTVFTPRQVRALKWLVFALGVLLVICFGIVIATIVYQASQLGQGAQVLKEQEGEAISASPPIMTLGAEDDQSVSSLSLDGDRLAVHLRGMNGEEIVIIDLLSGRTLSRIEVAPR